jgi:hypothetical protein
MRWGSSSSETWCGWGTVEQLNRPNLDHAMTVQWSRPMISVSRTISRMVLFCQRSPHGHDGRRAALFATERVDLALRPQSND